MIDSKDAGTTEVFLRSVDPEAPNAVLLDRAQAGSTEAWGHIVTRYERLVWSVIRRYGVRRTDAQDLFQLVFLLLHTHMHQVREPDKLGLWLHTTTRRECARFLKRAGRTRLAESDADTIDLADPRPTPEEEVAAPEGDIVLRRSFQQPSPACRRLLEMCLADPRPSYDEMAESMSIRRGTVGAKRRRCLDRLADLYQGTAIRV